MTSRSIDKRSFGKLVKTIEQRIGELVPVEDSRKARLFDLAQVQKNEMSAMSSLQSTWTFLISWLFYGATFFYTLLHIAPKGGA